MRKIIALFMTSLLFTLSQAFAHPFEGHWEVTSATVNEFPVSLDTLDIHSILLDIVGDHATIEVIDMIDPEIMSNIEHYNVAYHDDQAILTDVEDASVALTFSNTSDEPATPKLVNSDWMNSGNFQGVNPVYLHFEKM